MNWSEPELAGVALDALWRSRGELETTGTRWSRAEPGRADRSRKRKNEPGMSWNERGAGRSRNQPEAAGFVSGVGRRAGRSRGTKDGREIGWGARRRAGASWMEPE